MILTQDRLDQRLSVEDQEKELSRIREAPAGEELFSARKWDDLDLIETFIFMSKVKYHISFVGSKMIWIKD